MQKLIKWQQYECEGCSSSFMISKDKYTRKIYCPECQKQINK